MRPRAGDLAPLAGPARQLGRAQQSARRGGASGVGGHPPGTTLGRPPSALRARLKTNRPGNCGGQPARRVAAHARPTCTHVPALTGARPGPSSVSLQAAWAPGLGSGPQERRVLTRGPIRPWEGGRTDGWEPGGPGKRAREGRQGLGPGCQHGMEATRPGTGQGGGEECQWPWLPWAGESGEQMPLCPPEAKLRRRPGALLGSRGVGEHGPFSGGRPWACCSHK